ncbi:TPA: Gfo/Idh/MocA family oxidoreductase [Candidatus Poribacteria bacterium]|nr:Gfo/Idh/MocA family oxidoreductase [Candidatus Poribacteria bacterium]HIA66369.1 Gfo/Idh/MocA family oxidoreductase [Candidatus Poribacteria bacterium]HIB87600.1 Gfo/Idh/MocA family oxidoreductase [Candidatus Poribacteria bacterium]HIC02471.1 Gfo/Idh/MocA family oxidoreductase [Candidatus Poribacteria bacterium]HIN31591.1 Gfo/Idh/MocA family oxidoreductase [Candidatus Poribacteria bacterium]
MIGIAKLSFAHVHAKGYANAVRENPETELVAVWDEEEYGGRQIAEEYRIPFSTDLDQILGRDDVDAVVVDAVTSDHPRVIVAAAEAGKHIFTEKAMAITVAECDEIIDAVERSGVKFMISMPQRCDSSILFAKKAIDDGLLGDITFGRFRIAHSAALDKWFSGPSAWFADSARAGGGALFDLGCHPVYRMRWLMGEPKRTVSIMNNFTGHYPIDDNSVSVVEFKNNAIGLVDCSWVHRSGPNLTEIYGTEGSIVIGQGDLQFQTRKLSEEQQAEDLANMPNSLPSSMQQWINAILYDETMSITIQDGRDLTELMQGFYMANEQGKSIDFPL